MNRFAMALAAMLLTGVVAVEPAQAQAQQGQQRRPGGRGGFGGFSVLNLTPPLQTKLALNEEQKAKIKAINEKLRADNMALMQSAAQGDRRAAFMKVQENRTKAEGEVLALLNADQKKMVDGWKAEAQAYEGLGPAGPALLSVTGLTDEQKSKLKALSADTQTKRRDVLQSVQGDRQAAQEKLRALQMETTTALGMILNADQTKQLQEALQAGGDRPRRPQQN
jgi:hypothetical protein